MIPARNRASCLGDPSASGWRSRSAASASALTLVSIGGFGSGSWKLLGVSGQAVAAVPAWLGARLAEVADEGGHLAAVMGDEGEDGLDPGGLRSLPAREAIEQAVDELGLGVRMGEERVALAQLGGLQLDEALLVEVLERRQDPAALLTELRRSSVGCECRPGSARLARREQAAQEAGPRLVEVADRRSSSDPSPSGRRR